MSRIGSGERDLTFITPMEVVGWNRKLCWEARDTLFGCVDQQDNKNKFRCPDELYAYEMWCPPDFRRVASYKKRREDRDELNFDKQWVLENNFRKQSIF